MVRTGLDEEPAWSLAADSAVRVDRLTMGSFLLRGGSRVNRTEGDTRMARLGAFTVWKIVPWFEGD